MKKNKKLHDVYALLDDGTERLIYRRCKEPYTRVRVWVRRETDGSEVHLTCGASTRPMPLILQDFFFKREIAREYIARTRLVELNQGQVTNDSFDPDNEHTYAYSRMVASEPTPHGDSGRP